MAAQLSNLDPNYIYSFLHDHHDERQRSNASGSGHDLPPHPGQGTISIELASNSHSWTPSQSSSSTSSRSTTQSSTFSRSWSWSHGTTTTEVTRREEIAPGIAAMIANQTPRGGRFVLPCEFAWMGYGGNCDVNFDPDETDLWIHHIISCHLREKLPSKALCWFCDEFEFDIKSTRGDRRANFDNRMAHIRDHIYDGKTVHQIRPDFHLLEHLRKHRLVSQKVADEVTTYEGSGHSMSGIYRHDWLPDEQVQRNEKRARVAVNNDKEDREWRRARQRRGRGNN